MSQQRGNPPQQGLQRQPQQGQQGAVEKAVPMTGTLRRLPERGGSTADPNQATQWIDEAYQESGLVAAPFGNSVPMMGPGYAVSATPVQVTDLNDGFDGTQIYPIKGSKTKKGLYRTVMDDLATGMGFDWPPQWTWREKFNDERDHDRLCARVTVCGRYKDVDGSWKSAAPQTKDIDLRESYIDTNGQVKVPSEVEEIRTRHLQKQMSDLPPNATEEAKEERRRIAKRNADAELAPLRKYIEAHATTKARLRVIATKVRRSYTIEELRRGPIWCFRVVQTWRSDNPETQKRFDDAIIEREMGSSRMLYGETPSGRETATPRALPPVSDEPYPEPQDAGVVNGNDAPAGESPAGQGDGSESSATAVQGQETPDQTNQRQCSVETGCLGPEPGVKHILACYGKAEPEPEQTQTGESEVDEQPWVLQQGPARNLPVNDPKVTVATLVQMEHELAAALNPSGLLRGTLSDEQVDLFSQELRKIGEELNRRKVTQGRLQK